MKRLIYFVANESVSNGLLQAQLLQPLEGAGLSDAVKVINIVHPMVRPSPKLRHIHTLRCGIPARFYQFKLGGWMDRIIASYYGLILCFVVPRNSRIVARSYFSAMAVFALQRFKKVELIFDTRSQFIQENLSSGRIKPGSTAHKSWLDIESTLLKRAIKVLAVSEAQARYYRNIAPNAHIQVIPCFSQPNYQLLTDESRTTGRTNMGFQSSDIIICYYGSLDSKWNNIRMYADFFVACLDLGYKVCVITPNSKELMIDSRLNRPEAFIQRIDNPTQARSLIAACDYGVILMKKSEDWESRLGVKFVEYLSAGLQVMVGEWVGAAAETVRQHFNNTGKIIKGELPRPPHHLSNIDLDRRLEIARRAEAMFGNHKMREVFDD